MQTPAPNGHRETYVRTEGKTDTTVAPLSARQKEESKGVASQRLRVLRRRPSADRKSAARPGGSVPKRGRPSSRSATRQSRVAQRAGRRPLTPLSNLGFPPRAGEMSEGQRGRVGRPAKGRETSRGADRRLPTPAARGRLQRARSPLGRIQGGRRTPNGDSGRRAELHARGLATRAVSGKGC